MRLYMSIFLIIYASGCNSFNLRKKFSCIDFNERLLEDIDSEDVNRIRKRNLLIIKYDTLQCLTFSKSFKVKKLEHIIYTHVLNKSRNTYYSNSPINSRIVVSALSYDNTDKNYLVVEELQMFLVNIYNKMRKEIAIEIHKKSYSELTEVEIQRVNEMLPYNISTDAFYNMNGNEGLQMK